MKLSRLHIKRFSNFKIIFVFGLVVLFACKKDNQIDSILMRFTSKSFGEQKIYDYKLETIINDKISTFKYSDKENEIEYSLIFDSDNNSISIIENDIKSKTIFLGAKNINLNDRVLNVKCYLVDNPDILGERQTIFFNKEHGLIISDFTSGFYEYIKTTEKSDDIEKVFELIKNDTDFMNLDKEYIYKSIR